jgi:orotidine-5'-phosphate decarboxylase
VNEPGRIIFAIDTANADTALQWVDRLKPAVDFFKVGLELFVAAGPSIVARIKDRGVRLFLDLKFHDIPNTVAGAVAEASRLGADIINVHAGGGLKMLKAAAEAAHKNGDAKIIGVTVLTSLDQVALGEVGVPDEPRTQVLRLAGLCRQAGLDGVVCSPREIEALRADFGKDFLIITPGIRPGDSGTDDQVRIATPEEAIAAGSNYLVIGRPISGAKDPVAAAEKIAASIVGL